MTTTSSITGHSAGDDVDVSRTVTGVPDGVTIVKAWLMVKRSQADADAEAVISKTITAVAVDGTGQITDTGLDGTGALLFQFRSADTTLLTAGKTYRYGIKVLLSSGLKDTLETGTIVLEPQLITANS